MPAHLERLNLIEERSLENPSSTLADPEEWLVELLQGGKTSSGVRINRKTALTYAAVWRAVSLISRDVAKLPLFVHRRLEGGGKEKDRSHRAYSLLKRKPNREMSAFIFKQTLQAHVLLHGNGYAYVFRLGDGSPEEIVILDPEQTYPVREEGRLFYVTEVDGEHRLLLPENVMHLKGLGYDGLIGYSVLAMAASSLGMGIAARDYGGRFFRNDARPSMILEAPGTLNDRAVQQLKQMWNSMHKGLDNSHKLAVLQHGLTAKTIGANARESQLIETREFEIRDVANWFNLPPHKLGDSSRTAYNSLEQENLAYLQEALDGWLCVWEEECEDKLLSERQKEQDSHTIRFRRQALIRADIGARSSFYSTALQNGFLSIDEVRELEDMNPLPDGQGEKFHVNLALGELSGEAEGDADDGDRKMKLMQSHRAMICDAGARMIRRIRTQAMRAVKQTGSFPAWAENSLRDDNEQIVKECMAPIVESTTVLFRTSADVGEIVNDLFGEIRKDIIAITEQQDMSEWSERLNNLFGVMELSWPSGLADTLIGVENE